MDVPVLFDALLAGRFEGRLKFARTLKTFVLKQVDGIKDAKVDPTTQLDIN